MLAFGSALDGLRCAIGMQRAFAERNAQAEESVRVRIGLHTGEAIKEADDFFGSHVNLAARVGGAAMGDEILVSSLLKALTESAGEFSFDEGRDKIMTTFQLDIYSTPGLTNQKAVFTSLLYIRIP